MSTTDQTQATTLPLGARVGTPRKQDLESQQRRWGWVFISPWIFGFAVFTAAPIIFSLILTFTDFNLGNPDKAKFIGIANWARLFTDPLGLLSIGVTIKFGLMAVPFGLVVPLLMAALVSSKALYGKRVWTTLFYMPYIVPAVSSVFIWLNFMNGNTGWLNRLLRAIGISSPPNYFQDPNWILFAFLLIGVWGSGNAMLVMMASMGGVPTELYEAAEVDGANTWTRFRKITLPMISPVIFYNLVLSVIGQMQYFVFPYIATQGSGDPNKSAYFYLMHFYKTGFTFFDMGYAATQAWLLFIVALVLTVVLFTTSRRWVYYSSEG